jgi:ABC-type uncharacterized transport system permease subunit
MVGLLSVYKEQLKIEAALKMQYRAQTLLIMLQMAVEPIVYLVVWRTVASVNGGEINGFSGGTLASYYIIFTFMRQFVAAPSMWLFESRIREGYMSMMLLHPLHPIHIDIAENLGYKLFSSLALIPILIVICTGDDWFLADTIGSDLGNVSDFANLFRRHTCALSIIVRTPADNCILTTIPLDTSLPD